MYFVYILKSETTGRFYIGQTNNPEDRLRRHNARLVSSTKAGVPWKIILIEEYSERKSSMAREKYLKTLKGKGEFATIVSKCKASR